MYKIVLNRLAWYGKLGVDGDGETSNYGGAAMTRPETVSEKTQRGREIASVLGLKHVEGLRGTSYGSVYPT